MRTVPQARCAFGASAFGAVRTSLICATLTASGG